MAEDWNAIAAEVAAAVADVGVALTLRRPNPGPTTPFDSAPEGVPSTFAIYAVPNQESVRNEGGALIGVTRELLLVAAIGVVPQKQDEVFVRGTWRQVLEVRATWQGNIDLVYELVLAA